MILLPGMSPRQALSRVTGVVRKWIKDTVSDPAGNPIPMPGARWWAAYEDGDEARVILAAADTGEAGKERKEWQVSRSEPQGIAFSQADFSFSAFLR